jgi:hypothetical protein
MARKWHQPHSAEWHSARMTSSCRERTAIAGSRRAWSEAVRLSWIALCPSPAVPRSRGLRSGVGVRGRTAGRPADRLSGGQSAATLTSRPADMRQPSTIAESVRLGSRPGFIPPRVRPRSLLLVLAIVTGTAPRGRPHLFHVSRRSDIADGSAAAFPLYAESLWQLIPSARPRHFIPAGINAGGPASRAPEPELLHGPGGPPARAARTPGDHPRLLPAICRTRSRYRVTIVRLARLAALGTPANMAHIGPEQR